VQTQPSKFSELRKLQSQNTKSNQALDALRNVNQQEMINQQFKQVKEEQENEDKGFDGRIYKDDKLSDEEIMIPNPDGHMRNTVSGTFYDQKKHMPKKSSVVKNYGDITN
jgi:hypothetical protein